MAGHPTYIYEKGQSEWPPQAVELIHSNDLDVEVVEASEWEDTERMEFYQSKLFPRSVRQGKKLRGRVRTHKAGKINFYNGVLVTGGVEDGDFFIGEEAVDRLQIIETENTDE